MTTAVFFCRSLPSKLDYDVLMAIGPDVNLSSYQNVLKWYTLISSYSEEEKKRCGFEDRPLVWLGWPPLGAD